MRHMWTRDRREGWCDTCGPGTEGRDGATHVDQGQKGGMVRHMWTRDRREGWCDTCGLGTEGRDGATHVD